MVSTPLKNISQIGSFPQVGVKIENIWNHQLSYIRYIFFQPNTNIKQGNHGHLAKVQGFQAFGQRLLELGDVTVKCATREWDRLITKEKKRGKDLSIMCKYMHILYVYICFINCILL